MPIAWTDCETLKLINLYGQYECLRNPFHSDFKNKLCRYKAYKEIVEAMNITGLTVCDCIKRITYVKTQYCYELSKINAAISCEKFYRPKAIWFAAMHELLFPFIRTCNYPDNSSKIRSREENVCKCYRSDTNDNVRYPHPVELGALNAVCNCSYTNCDCSEISEDRNAESKKSGIQTGSARKTLQTKVWDSTDYPHISLTKKVQIDVGSNTNNNNIVQHGIQTDVSCFKNEYKTFGIYFDQKSTSMSGIVGKNDPKEDGCVNSISLVEESRKRKPRDEFDMFGKSIAFQLRNINFEAALELEKHIQDLITQERLNNIKSKCVPRSIGSDCSCSCSDCKVIHKEVTCSCGLPLIMIKTDRTCEFGCK